MNKTIITATNNINNQEEKEMMSTTKTFKEWTAWRLEIAELHLQVAIGQCEHALSERRPMHEHLFESAFKSNYFFIKDEVEVIEAMKISGEINLDEYTEAISQFKEMKHRVRKTKSEYKTKFTALREAIAKSLDDEETNAKVSAWVAEFVQDWCSSHTLIVWCKECFEGKKLEDTLKVLTHFVMSSKLHPDKEEISSMLEDFMQRYSVL